MGHTEFFNNADALRQQIQNSKILTNCPNSLLFIPAILYITHLTRPLLERECRQAQRVQRQRPRPIRLRGRPDRGEIFARGRTYSCRTADGLREGKAEAS